MVDGSTAGGKQSEAEEQNDRILADVDRWELLLECRIPFGLPHKGSKSAARILLELWPERQKDATQSVLG